MKNLTGSEKQVAWADEIRKSFINKVKNLKFEDMKYVSSIEDGICEVFDEFLTKNTAADVYKIIESVESKAEYQQAIDSAKEKQKAASMAIKEAKKADDAEALEKARADKKAASDELKLAKEAPKKEIFEAKKKYYQEKLPELLDKETKAGRWIEYRDLIG